MSGLIAKPKIRKRMLVLLFTMAFLPGVVMAEEVHAAHPEIQAALDWQLPENTCKFKYKRTNVGGSDRRYNKALKKYTNCNDDYLTGLAVTRNKMMALADHGLTREQTHIIMTHMAVIKIILERSGSPSAVPEWIRETNQTADFNG